MAAELLHLNKDNWSGIRLGLIEELEAHLHPQAQMQVIEALQKYNQIQLILTTHSPNLASKLNLEDLIICNNANAFPMGEAYTKLGKENYKFLEKFLDTTKANLFFVKGVILVEGWAEEILIPSIAKAIGINLTEKGVSIVNIGHTGFDHYAKIYLRQAEPHMKIPVAVITDSDIREYEKAGNNCIKRNANTVQQETTRKLSEINGKSEINVQYFSAPNWTFEKELAEKLISKVLKKTEIVYRIANTIDEDLEKFEKKEIEAKTITISEDANDTVSYLIKAIKYATGNYNN